MFTIGQSFGTLHTMIHKIKPDKQDSQKQAGFVRQTMCGVRNMSAWIGKSTVIAVRDTLGIAHPGNARLEQLRSSFFKELFKIRTILVQQGAQADEIENVESLISQAEAIRQIILDNSPPGRRKTIAVDSIVSINEHVSRDTDERAMMKIQRSVKEFGLRNPPIVTKAKGGFELIAGYFRYEAYKKEHTDIPVIIKTLSIDQAAELAVLDALLRNGPSRVDVESLRSVLLFYNEMVN